MMRRASEMPLRNCKPCVARRSPVRCEVGSKKSFDAGSGSSCSTPTYIVRPEKAYNPGTSVEACAPAISESQSASTTMVLLMQYLRSTWRAVSWRSTEHVIHTFGDGATDGRFPPSCAGPRLPGRIYGSGGLKCLGISWFPVRAGDSLKTQPASLERIVSK